MAASDKRYGFNNTKIWLRLHETFICLISPIIHDMKPRIQLGVSGCWLFSWIKDLISLIAYVFAKVFMFIVHCICSALSCRLSAQFCPQLPHGCSAFCCLNMSLTHIPLLKPKTLPSVCADLVNPGIIKKISPYFWRSDVFFDLREIAYYSCYHAQGQRLFCTSDCWHC